MKVSAPLAALVLALACGRAHAQAPAGECTAAVAASWAPLAGKIYRVRAVAAGRNCLAANVTLTIRPAAGGAPLLSFTSAAADLPLIFARAATAPAMAAALRRWIAQPPGRTTRSLPDWPAGQDEPKARETIFHPEPAITRGQYLKLRTWGQPLFCFLQGTESEACYGLDIKTDSLTLIGTRTLPG